MPSKINGGYDYVAVGGVWWRAAKRGKERNAIRWRSEPTRATPKGYMHTNKSETRYASSYYDTEIHTT